MDSERVFVYRIDSQNRITFLNQDWLEFARDNQAPELSPSAVLGHDLSEYIADWETRHLYDIIYQRVRQSGKTIHLPFRCDSPEQRRFFQMSIAALPGGGLEFSVRVIRIEPRQRIALLDPSTRHAWDRVVICSWCKRIEILANQWVDLETVIDREDLFSPTPPSLTHDVCPDCLASIQEGLEQQ